ncbi:amidohydrolase family protein [Rubrivirga sp.]|uniref:amidohydrolase family protein n=1 Tax=Rubrivirga sp. TaxID=1885344 RepID=UPI003B51629D
MRLISAFLLVFVLATGGAAQEHALAFVDVALVPMDSARVVEHQTVVVRAGRIERVGNAAEVAVPADAQRVDGRGRFLMPGLADMHTHLAHPETDQFYADDNRQALALFLAYGVTTVRSMWGSPGLLALRDSLRRGDVLGPQVFTASPFVDGRGQYDDASTFKDETWRFVAETPDAARSAVREIHAAGYDFVKVYSSLSLPAYRAVLDEAEAVGIPVVGHVPWSVGLARVLTDPRQASVEHYSPFFGLAEASDSPVRDSTAWWWRGFGPPAYAETERLAVVADIAAASGIWFSPTLLISEWASAPQPRTLARLDAPELVRFTPPAQRAGWRSRAEGFAANYARWGVDMAAQRTFALALARALHASGANLMLGTDDTPALVPHGIAVHDELALWAKAGLTPFETLRLATVAPHDFLREWGLGEGTGTLREGEPADLVLLRADPLVDVANARRIEGVAVRGRYLDRALLDDLLAGVERAYAE